MNLDGLAAFLIMPITLAFVYHVSGFEFAVVMGLALIAAFEATPEIQA